MSRKLTYVEIDLDYCQNTYGSYPCTASVPTTGDRKCYNTLRTCQDIENFVTSTVTMRFAVPASYLPKEIECIPNIQSIDFVPSIVSLGEGLGQRATLSVVFSDHAHSDTGFNKDPYLSERGWDAFKRGTFWGKFRSRYPYVQGRALRMYRGELGQSLAEMEVRHYVMESYDGPGADGTFRIVAKDILKLVDNDRALAPARSQGYLLSAITAEDTGCTLTPSGVGAEYPEIGDACLGGNEIVRFIRMRSTQEASCVLALHFEGLDASTTVTDSSTFGHTVTVNGNAQIDTEIKRIGASSLKLDGTDDWVRLNGQSEFAFGTGDFTIAFWVKFDNFGATQTLYDSRPAATNGNYLRIYRDVASFGTIRVHINSVDVLESETLLNAGNTDPATWFNIVVMRASGVIYLFIDGNLEDSAANTTSLLNGAQRPVIGTSGNAITTEGLPGHFDEFVIFNEAIFDPDTYNTPLGIAFPDTANRDSFSIERAQRGTLPVSHGNDDKFQLCLEYSGMTPANIIYDLFVNYAAIPPEYIDLSAWQTEVDTYLQRNFGAMIADPTGVAKLVSELLEQSGCSMWWDDLQQRIRLRVLRPVAPEELVIDEEMFIESTIEVTEQFDKRVSQAWCYYGQINPTEPADQANNYRSTVVTVDLQEESNFGAPAIKKIFCRWIPQFARSTALRLNDLVIGRFKYPPRRFKFHTFGDVSRDVITLGQGYNAQFRTMQDDTGARQTVPVILTYLDPRQDVYRCEAEEALFAPFDADALNNRVIVIDTDTYDFNLREVHDSIFPVITDPYGISLTCIIETGVIVGSEHEEGVLRAGRREVTGTFSTSNESVAFTVGDWPMGLDITIVMRGSIRGVGGQGGALGTLGLFTTRLPGQDGGTGLYTRYPINIECADSTPVIAGGGGGGSSGTNTPGPGNAGSGGGGAGQEPGPGGIFTENGVPDTDNSEGNNGDPGSLIAGGAGGGNEGPAGGAPGVEGEDTPGMPAGAGGYAIDGISYVTYTDATPTIAGDTVN